MKKNNKIFISIIIVTISIYGVAWIQMYINSIKYFKDAMESYNNKDYVMAIKGKKIEKDDGTGYVFKGGFQQVVDIWSDSFAVPKPGVYKKSLDMINEIVDKNIDIRTGTEMFNRYFKIDKEYLNIVMLKVADLYIEANDIKGAKEILEIIKEAFPNDIKTQEEVKNKLESINLKVNNH